MVKACCCIHTVHKAAAPMTKGTCLCNSTYSIYESDRQRLLQTVCSVLRMDSDSPTQSLPFPCTLSHLPPSSLPNEGVTTMTKDSPQNETQHQAEKSGRIQFRPKTNILQSIALYRFHLLVFHQFLRLARRGLQNIRNMRRERSEDGERVGVG